MGMKLGITLEYFLWSFLAGLILAFLYDFLRTSRQIFFVSVIGINIEDILFLGFSALIHFLLAYYKNNGELRFQSFVGSTLGFFLYRKVFRNIIVKLMLLMSDFITRSFVFIVKIFCFPLRVIYRVLAKPFLVIGWYSRCSARRLKHMKKRLLFQRNVREGKSEHTNTI